MMNYCVRLLDKVPLNKVDAKITQTIETGLIFNLLGHPLETYRT